MIKKMLLGATAATVITGLASPSMAAEKIQLQLGGYMEQFFGGVKAINEGNLGGGSSGFGQDRETRITVSGKTTLDNGLTVGAYVMLRGEGSNFTTNVKRQYAFVSGDFGWFSIGEQNGVVDRFAVLAPDQGGRNNQELMDWINTAYTSAGRKGNVTRIPTLKAFLDDNALRMMYITPSFYGFSAGVSFAPNAEVNNNTGVRVREERLKSNEIQAGLAYAGQIGQVGVNADASFSTTIDGRERWAYRSGLALNWGGWTVGGSYMGTSAENDDIGNVWNASANHVFEEDLWEFGVRYVVGPYGFSATYGQNESDLGSAMLVQTAASYKLGPGVTALGQVFYGENDANINYDRGDGRSSTYRNGVGVVTSLLLEF